MLKARTLYLDDDTYENLARLAKWKGMSRSAIARIMINELHFDHRYGDTQRAKTILNLGC